MKKQRMFSVAHLRAHTDDLVNAVTGSSDAVVIATDGTPKVVLQDFHAYESLRRTLTLLERIVADDGPLTQINKAEIRAVLADLQTSTQVLDDKTSAH